MIHVAVSFNDDFAKFAGTTILSIFENTSADVTIHILHDNTLTENNRDKFVYMTRHYHQTVKFYNIEKNFFKELNEIKSHFAANIVKRFSITAAFRLIIGKIFPTEITKIVYLDSDTVCNLDVNELWKVELNDKPLAAVPEHDNPEINSIIDICRDGIVKTENYFNTGVMVMNLEKLRHKEDTIKAGINFVTGKNYGLFNQNIFNYCFSEQILKLPRKFNVWVREQPRFDNTPIEKKIYHYIGKGESLDLDMRDKYNHLYWHYFCKTPWFNEETVGKIAEGVREIYSERQKLMIKISSIFAEKSRAFVTAPQNINALKKIFSIRQNENILRIGEPNWLENLVTDMEISDGGQVFIILEGRIYPRLCEILTQVGFIEGRDFINGEIFLSEEHGVPLNLYSIIQKM